MADEKVLTGYPTIDKPWLKYYTQEDLAIQPPRCTVYQNILNRNKDYPEDIAIRYYGNKIHYRTLFSKVELCAKALRHIGVQPGECITLCMAGIPEAVFLVLACSRIGAIANFINPLFAKNQMTDRINETGSVWAFVLDSMHTYIEAALPETCIRNVVIIPATNSVRPPLSRLLYLKSPARKILRNGNGKQRFLGWRDFCAFGPTFLVDPDVPYLSDRATVMVYSSGSTGASKGILLTNDGINATINHYQTHSYTYSRGDTFLQMIPIWFSTGIVLSILMPLAKGISVILEPKFSKESFAADLKKYEPEMTLAATSLWLYVVNKADLNKIDLSRMKYPITGGEKVLPKDEQNMNAFLKNHNCTAKMYKGYGMCELGGTVTATTNSSNYTDKDLGTGIPLLHGVVGVFDLATDKELPYGQHGELRVLSPTRMKGYYNNPEATAEFFKTDAHGAVWGCTGDIGYIDKDGEVFVLGRASDHYRRENGEIVFLFDIEAEILKDGTVDQCKVVDTEVEGKTWLVAHIVLRKPVTDKIGALSRIHRLLAGVLPDYMVPNYYKVRNAMPVHTNGKMDVCALREDREGLIPAKGLA